MRRNVWAEQIKSEISLKCSKSFIEQGEFSLVNSKSIFVPSELSFENSRSWKQEASRIIVTFRCKFAFIEHSIFFRRKAKKSREFRRNTFALLLHNTVAQVVLANIGPRLFAWSVLPQPWANIPKCFLRAWLVRGFFLFLFIKNYYYYLKNLMLSCFHFKLSILLFSLSNDLQKSW